MNRTSISHILIFATFLILLSCSSKEGNRAEQKTEEKTTTPIVYVSNYPLQYFVERIASPWVEVLFPAQSTGDPTYWHPAPETVIEMQQADLIVINGASYEHWLKEVSLPQSRIVNSVESFKARLIALEETVTHSHGPEGKHEHSGTAFTTWLDFSLAIEQARTVKGALSARWPEYKQNFEDRFTKLESDLHALDGEIIAIVAKAPERPVVFSHPVYQYFQRRYGINGKSVHWEPDQMPDEEMWAGLQKLLKTHPAKWMIWESEPLSEVVDKLDKMGLKSIVFDPCGNIPEEGDFISVMQRNIGALKRVY